MNALVPSLVEGGGDFLSAVGEYFGNSDQRKLAKLKLRWLPQVYDMLQSGLGKSTFDTGIMGRLTNLHRVGMQPEANRAAWSTARSGGMYSPDVWRAILNGTIARTADYQTGLTRNVMTMDAQKDAEIRQLLAGMVNG